ncbi:MAG: galactose-1-phosphate uridylyltransferase, partial [Clostridia bacterium]|nr:galactose-1-phosphate uridylyltransferase [Clostridia bacterium]
KKENMGLIEVMGLAVLPARLKSELERVGDAIASGEDVSAVPEIAKHSEWVDSFRDKYDLASVDLNEVIRREVGATFVEVLRDCAVFKETDEGNSAFMRFIDSLK